MEENSFPFIIVGIQALGWTISGAFIIYFSKREKQFYLF